MPRRNFGLSSLIARSVRHGKRISASVAIGVATATAVIVGALLVGDSMRGSLRALTVERLGMTDSIVAPGSFFQSDKIVAENRGAAAVLFFPSGIAEHKTEKTIQRAGSVQLIGCDEAFWNLDVGDVRPSRLPTDDGVVLNQSAASELNVTVGDTITVRLPVEQAVPADSPLGRRDVQSEGLPRMTVLDILPDQGLGRFAILPSQASPRNVYLRRETVADALDRNGQANMVLFPHPITRDELPIDLPALGLKLKRIQKRFPADDRGETIYDYFSLTSDRLLIPTIAVDPIINRVGDDRAAPVMTYLANAIERVSDEGQVTASVPYSTITAIDSSTELPLDFRRPDGASPAAVPLVLNQWAAKQLDASVGTPLRVAYYEPEVENGREVERFFDAVVTQIVPITAPAKPFRLGREAVFDQPPTVYNDPDLTPLVPGVTDQDSINDWDLPFTLQREISSADDLYWNDFRLTPKAFLPLATGQRLFGSRFGHVTGLRIQPTEGENEQALASTILASLRPQFDALGWAVQPIREQQLNASRGTTPFDALFLSLSFFVILSALMLIAMLFRLGLSGRLKELGTLLAVGWTPQRVGRVVLGEGALVATAGVLIGIVVGIGYAMFVLFALRSWWVGAVTVPFLTFHWTFKSILIGATASWWVAMLTLWITTRSIVRVDAQQLLSGRDTDSSAKLVTTTKNSRRWTRLPIAAMIIAAAAVAIASVGASMGGQAAAGGFVGGGMLLLIATMLVVYDRLKRPRTIINDFDQSSLTLGSLAVRNGSRNPLRSTMTIGLMATASFLIIAITAFQLRPTEKGTGGFDLIAQSAQPLYRDFAAADVQQDLLGENASQLESAIIAPLRLREGQDASCNNLYQATAPTVLGVRRSFPSLFRRHADRLAGFEWASAAPTGKDESPWDLLSKEATGTAEDPIPVVIDQNTAMWSLQMHSGIGEVRGFEFDSGKSVFFQVVGLLSNSLLQGKLLIGEANFEKQFPSISGYRLFLMASSGNESLAPMLENELGDVGMDVSETRDVLSGMLAVQNTYLRTFQSLGALGLLLGTIGLAVAQLRSVLERRGELAVMRAVGFTRHRLAGVVMRETAMLLGVGIGCGALCALFAVLPYGRISGIHPPWMEPLVIVLGIVAFGLLAGLLAVIRVVKMPLLESLRSG
ncbi:ABC transporter permease [Novipirellula artificiosorum]|uniref:FtsX-like permease family protein n=1 Tax=Novipirellula artificiosorum TaxID=2528016 RepID=A0A5C6DEL0_9BACT|nr:FtsX-like permease family protein [Novipirellula artificiosorum]TWU35108.1 FtsX-like permease family protein [Novipirellula artificiosorum]